MGGELEWEEAVPWERLNTPDWGLAREELMETALVSTCA